MTVLSGHGPLWREWRAAMTSGRMHHGWILTGPKGIGKATFALAAAAELVAETGVPQVDPHGHPDIITLAPLPANDAEEAKQAEGKPFQTKRNISVDQIRRMQQRLTTRPTLGSRRAIIIDAADDLEKGAVNALLKSLEEPPVGTFFLLVTHRLGRLIPTVRSRCRMLRFAALNAAEVDAILAREAPQASPATRAAAVAAAEGSPGAALGFVDQDLGTILPIVQRILRSGDAAFEQRGQLAEAIGARPQRERIAAVLDLARAAIAAELGTASRSQQAAIIDAHAEIVRLTAQVPSYNFDPGLLAMEIGGLLARAAVPREAAN